MSLRYQEDFRSSAQALRGVLVPIGGSAASEAAGGMGAAAAPAAPAASGGARHVPLGELARVEVTEGPPMIQDEAGLLVGYVYVDVDPSRGHRRLRRPRPRRVVDGRHRPGRAATSARACT